MSNNQTEQKKNEKYTAVIYFHGMGNQRRYEEVSHLVDALDQYTHKSKDLGILAMIKGFLEPHWQNRGRDKAYLQVKHFKNKELMRTTRFYEVYWAPISAGATSTISVLKWIFRQIPTPLKVLLSPWRSRHRLHRSALFSLRDSIKSSNIQEYTNSDFQLLLTKYHYFEGYSSRRDFPKGSFDDFMQSINDDFRYEEDVKKRLKQLALKWRNNFILTEIKSIFVIFSFLLAMLLAAASTVAILSIALEFVADLGLQSWLKKSIFSGLATYIEPTVGNATKIAILLFSVLKLSFFLREYMGDVQLWTTYEEAQDKYRKRKEILEVGVDTLKQALKDELCERIVLVGHSLGTTIAFDSLLELGKNNRARSKRHLSAEMLDLEKIDHFISMGSPVDKVYYFFESHNGKSHRYNRVVDQIRGDMGYIPFAKRYNTHDKKSIPLIHWINFWDVADVVSDSLQSPNSSEELDLCVDNIHVRTYKVPLPGKSHSGYFENDKVLRVLFDTIFIAKNAFNTLPTNNDNKSHNEHFLGPGEQKGLVPLIQFTILLIPIAITLIIIIG